MTEEIEKEFLEYLLPPLFSNMLLDDALRGDENKEELVGKISAYLKRVDLTIVASFRESLLETVKEQVRAGRYQIACILSAMIFEHTINGFYYEVLMGRYRMTNTNLEKCLKTDLRDKVTWMFQIVTGEELDPGLSAVILENSRMRNALVHYKPFTFRDKMVSQESYEYLERLEEILEKLDSTLETTKNRLVPEFRQGKKLSQKFFDHSKSTGTGPAGIKINLEESI